ncbi:AAA family ATPase [Cryptosporangium arvum]|uniref:AAA family ATPase n=1 Tax=Cryptosporangium arvum TaxID=80871 RepID=UPI0004B89821|nr:AAA family ATPase [Cryptosporangium arvum]
MRRYILTGAPGCGKTTILHALAERGYSVVEEAAADVVAQQRALGVEAPEEDAGFVDAVIRLQHERQQQLPIDSGGVQLFDRSPICTLAFARYSGLPMTRALRTEVNRVVQSGIYQPLVFFVARWGPAGPTPPRRISEADAKRSEEIHRTAYESCGYELVDIPPGDPDHRTDLIDDVLADEDVRFSEEAWS